MVRVNGGKVDAVGAHRARTEFWAWVALTLALHCTEFASAQQNTRELSDALSIEGDAGCLEKPRLIAQIATWLGTTRVGAEVRVLVRRDASKPGSVDIEVLRGEQRRRRNFNSIPERCEDLQAVLGLAIALALDEERVQTLFLPNPAPSPTRAQAAETHVAALQLSAAERLLPDASLGAQLGIEFDWLGWLGARMDAFGNASWNDAIDGSEGRFHVILVGGSLQACMGGRLSPEFRIALCAGGAVGAVHAWGSGFTEHTRDTGPFVGIRSGLRIEARVGLRWMLDVEAISAVVSPSFEVERPGGESLIRKPTATGFLLSLGPALRF